MLCLLALEIGMLRSERCHVIGLAKMMLAEQALRNDQYVLGQWYWIAMEKDQSSGHSAERVRDWLVKTRGLQRSKVATLDLSPQLRVLGTPEARFSNLSADLCARPR